jgi:hypothetical protein
MRDIDIAKRCYVNEISILQGKSIDNMQPSECYIHERAKERPKTMNDSDRYNRMVLLREAE